MYRNSFRLTNREIDAAFAGRQIGLAFQPKLDLSDGRIVGVECFARWWHPEFGLLPPALFLPVLARQGREEELTRFVLGEALRAANGWPEARRAWTISINVAAADIADGSLPVSIRLALSAAEMDPARLVIEIPERVLAEDAAHAAATIHALAEIGTGLAVECALQPPLPGAQQGWSPQFDPGPFSEMKIGGTAMMRFASRIEGSGLGVVHEALAFAGRHGLATTAVGAESAATVRSLKRLGFNRMQGNVAAPAMAAEDLSALDGARILEGLLASDATPA